MAHQKHELAHNSLSSEELGRLFVNERGELINAKIELFVDPERGQAWSEWAAAHLPKEIFRDFRLIDAEGSEDWLNVVEHSIFVAAASLTLGQKLAEVGVSVNLDSLIREGVVHDVGKREEVESRGSREQEPYDHILARVLLANGYSYSEVEAAKNTGRLADRYITDPEIRRRHIASKTIEANIIGYCDARTRGAHLMSLEDAKNDSLGAKSKPADVEFFNNYWLPYYQDVESYFAELAPNFDPDSLTDDEIFATIQSPVNR